MSRHTANRMRRRRWTVEEARAIIADPVRVDRDVAGNPRYSGRIRGMGVRVVVAADDPNFIITIHERRKL